VNVMQRIQTRQATPTQRVPQQAVEEDQAVRYLIGLGNDPAFVLELMGAATVARLVSLHTLARQQTTGGNRRLLLREVYAVNHRPRQAAGGGPAGRQAAGGG
jgi:hypothetical protein